MLTWLRQLLDRYRAWRRGDVRVAPPPAVRGRLYGKSGEGSPTLPARGVSRATIRPTRVYRAATGTWEDL